MPRILPREQGEALSAPVGERSGVRDGGGEGELLAELQGAEETLRKLKALFKPFLNWAGKRISEQTISIFGGYSNAVQMEPADST